MNAHQEAAAIIRDHYGLARPVTDEEVRDEMSNLQRKHIKGNLDDNQQRLASRLGILWRVA